jgi:DNA polymerase V
MSQAKKGPEVRAVHPAQVDCRAARPLASSRVEAGFPSPADDYLEGALDLNEHLVKNPAATFFVRVSGESMTGAGIFPGDLLVVDRSLTPESGSVVIAVLDGELTVKRLWRESGRVELRADNPAYAPIPLSGMMELDVWGVVRHVIHPV